MTFIEITCFVVRSHKSSLSHTGLISFSAGTQTYMWISFNLPNNLLDNFATIPNSSNISSVLTISFWKNFLKYKKKTNSCW